MSTFFKKQKLATLISGVLAFSVAPVMAQDAEQDESAKQKEVEKILVTAQRRVQSIQEVPVAVTSIGAADLELKQVSNVLDLQYEIPNISIATNTGTASGARLFLRGVGEDESRVSADPAVGVYVDGVYVGRQVGALFDLVDLERVEVLRGPQGTLYGRNSNGGAIKLISKAPEVGENYGVVKATMGSDGRLDARLTGNLGISDTTAIRATVLTKSRDGLHTVNPNGDFANQAGTEAGEKDTKALRIALFTEFNDDWTMNLAVDYTKDNSDPVPDSVALEQDADDNLFTIEPVPGVTCSAATPATFLSIGCFNDYRSKVETSGITLNIQGSIDEYDLSFLSGYRELEDDLSSRIGFPYTQQTDQDQFSQEITLSSNYDGAFNFVSGVYYFNETVQMDSVFVFPGELGIETEAYAAFVQTTYDFNDTLTLTTGLRFTDETKEIDGFIPGTGNGRTEELGFDNTTYNIALNNQFTKDVMAYVSYSTGFKSGGWSPDCFSEAACFVPVDEEELDAFEIGVRSDLFDNSLRLNATYFYNMYDNLQIASTVPGVGFTRFNVDETEISGIELEAIYQVSDSLTINLTFGTIDGEYTELTLAQAGGLTNNGVSPGCNDVVSIECAKDLQLKNAPDYKGTIGFTHRMALGDGELTSRIDFSSEGDSYSLVANAPTHSLTSVDTLVNARIAYEPNNGKWALALWGKNLTDEHYARAAAAADFSQYAADPLMWGVDAEYRF
ncbi:TonB-dependent receptor [Paraglaciecola arctica]|uniref:TonB-dependent receptor n=1 Tax=Paraglaciecola arctica TaxID=1128911 RepID=UPI001C07ECD3|nr:TonB-dependent receptor [Paraglaciecola arctica]MBU3002618.1 TonB-dependent receptor [Paraglaciecola arctica]